MPSWTGSLDARRRSPRSSSPASCSSSGSHAARSRRGRAAGAVDRRRGAERGGGHRPLHPAAGADPGGDGQQHHQPARHRPDGLADLRRGPERMEAVLREDPAGFYPRMTFATRDHYRHVVERIAKRTGRSEEGGRAARRRAGRAPRWRRTRRATASRARRLLPDRRGPGRAGARPPAIARVAARPCTAGSGGIPTPVFVGGVVLGTARRARRGALAGGSASPRSGVDRRCCCSASSRRTTSPSTS